MKTALPLLSEYFGTFLLTLSFLYLQHPILIGIMFSIILFLTKPLSEGSTNPAISLVLYMKGKLGLGEMFAYILIEVVAAVSAFYIFKIIK